MDYTAADIEKAFSRGFRALLTGPVRRATVYLSPTCTLKVANMNKVRKNANAVYFAVSYGVPNYEERIFIKACKRAGEPFPVKKVQLKFWPKKWRK